MSTHISFALLALIAVTLPRRRPPRAPTSRDRWSRPIGPGWRDRLCAVPRHLVSVPGYRPWDRVCNLSLISLTRGLSQPSDEAGFRDSECSAYPYRREAGTMDQFIG